MMRPAAPDTANISQSNAQRTPSHLQKNRGSLLVRRVWQRGSTAPRTLSRYHHPRPDQPLSLSKEPFQKYESAMGGALSRLPIASEGGPRRLQQAHIKTNAETQ